MEIEKQLEQFGLVDKKAGVYLACLELGTATVQQIAKKASIRRTTTYDILEFLIQEGFITVITKNKKRYFVAESPIKLKNIFQEKQKSLEEILPQLNAIYNIVSTKPKIRFYENPEGIRNILQEVLHDKPSEILVAASVKDAMDLVGKEFMEYYITALSKLRIKSKTIRVRVKETKEKFITKQRPLRELRYASVGVIFDTSIIIFNSKVAIMSSQKEGFGFVIESPSFSQTMRVFFKAMWDKSKLVYKSQ